MAERTPARPIARSHPARGRRRVAFALLISCLVVATPHAFPGAAAPPELARLEQSNRELEQQLELARTDEPYLVLEPSKPRLRLMQGEAVLRDYDLLAIDVGAPAVAFVPRSVAAPEAGRARRLVALDPPRPLLRNEVFAPAADPARETPIIPPDPFEAQPAPARFFLRFDDGFAVEVRRDPGRTGVRLRWVLQDFVEAIRPDRGGRLRVVMSADEAGSLYRSVPPSLPLLVE